MKKIGPTASEMYIMVRLKFYKISMAFSWFDEQYLYFFLVREICSSMDPINPSNNISSLRCSIEFLQCPECDIVISNFNQDLLDQYQKCLYICPKLHIRTKKATPYYTSKIIKILEIREFLMYAFQFLLNPPIFAISPISPYVYEFSFDLHIFYSFSWP